MQVVAHSLNGCLRLVHLGRGKAVVEIRSHSSRGWTYCTFRSRPRDEAMEIFLIQCQFHTERDPQFAPGSA